MPRDGRNLSGFWSGNMANHDTKSGVTVRNTVIEVGKSLISCGFIMPKCSVSPY